MTLTGREKTLSESIYMRTDSLGADGPCTVLQVSAGLGQREDTQTPLDSPQLNAYIRLHGLRTDIVRISSCRFPALADSLTRRNK